MNRTKNPKSDHFNLLFLSRELRRCRLAADDSRSAMYETRRKILKKLSPYMRENKCFCL